MQFESVLDIVDKAHRFDTVLAIKLNDHLNKVIDFTRHEKCRISFKIYLDCVRFEQ